MGNRRVTLLGGSGFVGSQLTYRLAESFDEVIVLTRHPHRVRSLRTIVNVKAMQTNIHDVQALRQALSDSDVVINLVGILNEGANREKNSFSAAHVTLTDKVLDACSAVGVKRYLHMSALGADAKRGSSEYLRSKGQAEELIHNKAYDINWTIFRPSIIFGQHDSFFNRFASLLKAMPVPYFPLAVPNARMAPVFVDDVCKVMIQSIDDPDAQHATYPLCGPQEFTLRELLQYTADTMGVSCKIIDLPDWAARAQARLMEFVPGKPFTRDNYLSLQTPNVCGEGCPRQNTSLDAVVPRYIGLQDWSGRLQKRRATARR